MHLEDLGDFLEAGCVVHAPAAVLWREILRDHRRPDLDDRMVAIARENLREAGLAAEVRQGNVESLPYADGWFDTVLSTMAFSGFPDARKALAEMLRVLATRSTGAPGHAKR